MTGVKQKGDANGGVEVSLGYGGHQEGRGSSIKSNHFYVENVLEELDTEGEWFYDADAAKLYLYPNASLGGGGAPADGELVVPLLDTLIDISGADISLHGFEVTQTRATFMEPYEVPSGGVRSITISFRTFAARPICGPDALALALTP